MATVVSKHNRRKALEPEKVPKVAPRVKLGIASIEYAGAIVTAKGEKPSWRVTFQVDGENIVGTSLTVRTVGPADVGCAQQDAITALSQFAQGLLDAAETVGSSEKLIVAG